MNTEMNIRHDCNHHCFEAIVDGLRCELDYAIDGSIMRITHTGVPRMLEGRGIAAKLVQTALSWAREQKLKVDPVCSYVSAYMRRHSDWADLQVDR